MSKIERIEALRRMPWYTVDLPPVLSQSIGMISDDERRLLYVLARDYYDGSGTIIDGGAYLGTSSLALGHGLQDQTYPRKAIIHAFDTFVIDENSVHNYFDHANHAVLEIKAGDSIRSVYEGNITAVRDYIRVHEGDLLSEPWTGGPIAILFSDISKSWEINDYILTQWISSLLPETGILIQQDQVHEYHIWVSITMEILSDYFENIDYTPYSSMVYRLKHKIPPLVLEKCLSKNITHSEMEYYYLSFVERFKRFGMGKYKGWALGMVEAGLVVVYALYLKDADKAHHTLRLCEKRYSHIPDTMKRLAAIRQILPFK